MKRTVLSAILRTILPAAPLVIILGCTSQEEVDPDPAVLARLYPEVALSFVSGTPSFGDLVVARISIANATVDPIVIRGIDLPGQLPNDVPWLESRSGRTSYDRGRKRIGWRPWVRGETEVIFTRGYLLPGEHLTIDRWVRVRSPLQDVVVTYQKADLGIYYPDLGVSTRSQRLQRELFFYERSVTRESQYRRATPGSDERTVLFLAADQAVLTRRHITVPVAWAEPDMPTAVVTELGVPGELSAFDVAPAWLVRRPETAEVFLFENVADDAVDPSPAGESFPNVDFEVFDLVDYSAKAGADVLVDIDPEESFERVAPADFLEFLRGVRDQGSRVSVVALALGDPRYQLVLRLR